MPTMDIVSNPYTHKKMHKKNKGWNTSDIQTSEPELVSPCEEPMEGAMELYCCFDYTIDQHV